MPKISQFILSILIICLIWMGTPQLAVSSPEANTWNYVLSNSHVLDLPVNLSGYCINQNWIKIRTSGGAVRITGIGAIVATQYATMSRHNPKEISIPAIPYVISQKQNKRLFLIPERSSNIVGVPGYFNDFYPACTPKSNYLAINQHNITCYPQVLLNVDDESHRDILATYLKALPEQNLQNQTFLHSPIAVSSVSTVGELFEKVLSQKRAQFLEGLLFDVSVKLKDENQQAHTQFVVKSMTSLMPSLTELPQKEASYSSVPKQQFDDALQVIERLKEEKTGLVIKLEQMEQRLKSLKTQIVQLNSVQAKRETTVVRLETENADLTAQVKQLTNQLAETQKLCETHPEIVRLDQKILQMGQEKTVLERQVEQLTKKLAKAKQQCAVQPR